MGFCRMSQLVGAKDWSGWMIFPLPETQLTVLTKIVGKKITHVAYTAQAGPFKTTTPTEMLWTKQAKNYVEKFKLEEFFMAMESHNIVLWLNLDFVQLEGGKIILRPKNYFMFFEFHIRHNKT